MLISSPDTTPLFRVDRALSIAVCKVTDSGSPWARQAVKLPGPSPVTPVWPLFLPTDLLSSPGPIPRAGPEIPLSLLVLLSQGLTRFGGAVVPATVVLVHKVVTPGALNVDYCVCVGAIPRKNYKLIIQIFRHFCELLFREIY